MCVYCTRRSDVSNTAPLAGDSTVVKRYAKTHAKTKPEVYDGKTCLPPPTSYYVDTDQVQQYWCRPPTIVNDTVVDGEYNEGDKITRVTDIQCVQKKRDQNVFYNILYKRDSDEIWYTVSRINLPQNDANFFHLT